MSQSPDGSVAPSAAQTVLVVASDPVWRRALRATIAGAGFTAVSLRRVEQLCASIHRHQPALAVTDVTSLVEPTRWLSSFREQRGCCLVPLLAVSARMDCDAAAKLLDAGADDCVSRSLPAAELAARVRALIRRCRDGYTIDGSPPLVLGQLKLDRVAQQLYGNNLPAYLRPAEYRLIEFLLLQPHVAHTRATLAQVLRGDGEFHLRAVDTQMSRLRAALASVGCDAYVQSVRGRGYRLSDRPSARPPYGGRLHSKSRHPAAAPRQCPCPVHKTCDPPGSETDCQIVVTRVP